MLRNTNMYKEITTILTDYISVVWNDGEREEIPHTTTYMEAD
jgi:hypothetical protein